jgi:hypothetical protein
MEKGMSIQAIYSCMLSRRTTSKVYKFLASITQVPPNGLAFSCRERAAQGEFKIRTISRAKRSTAMPCWATRLARTHSFWA